MQESQQWTMIAMAGIAQHPANQPHVGELRQPSGLPIALINHVLRLDVEPELGGGVNTLGDRRVKAVQAIQQQNLVGRESNRLGRGAPALLETIDRLLDGL